MPVLSIEAANKVVCAKMMENACAIESHVGEDGDKKLWANYQCLNLKENANLGKRAAEQGIASTMQYFYKIDKNTVTFP